MPGAWDDDLHFNIPVTAEEDLSSKRFHAMKKGTADDGVVACGNTEEAWGILQEDTDDEKSGALRVFGVSKAIAGAAFDPGTRLMSNASGRLITATGSGAFVVARAIDQAGADGDITTVFVLPSPYALP